MYASMEPESVQATLEMLPDVIEMLGIGCARYLKALIPQLIHPLLPSPVKTSRDMQLVSLRVLGFLIDECLPRMPRWKGTILDAVAKCWVGIIDLGVDDLGRHIECFPGVADWRFLDSQKVKCALRDVCSQLATACPSVLQGENRGLLSLDPGVFSDLLPLPDEKVNSA
jgi:hypothetical protein